MYQQPYQPPQQGAYPPQQAAYHPPQPALYRPPAYPPQGSFPGVPAPPGYAPELMTGTAKIGFFCAGLFLSVMSLIVAWLASKGKTDAYAKEALKYSVIGPATGILCSVFMLFVAMAAFSSSFS